MMKKRIAVTTVAILLLAVPLHAVFGIGDVVFDPTSYANAVLMMGQLVKSYEQFQTQLNLQSFLSQVVPVDMGSRYRTPAASMQPLSVPYDRFGNLGAWVQQLNQGGSAGSAYNSATIPLQAYGPDMAQWPSDEQQKLASQYASLEFADSANIDTMGAIGQLRANASAADQAIAALEADSLSSDPSMNTEIGVLNKISAATIAQIRTSRDANQLLLQTVEQQLADSKRRRDADAAEMNAQIGRMEQGAAVKAQYTSTITDTLHSFRWQ
jgi:type IV secretion system protein TrbJ